MIQFDFLLNYIKTIQHNFDQKGTKHKNYRLWESNWSKTKAARITIRL